MSKFRSMIALIVVLVMLAGAYIYIVTREQAMPTPMGADRIKLLDFDSEEITKMVLESREETLTLSREGEQWLADYPYPITINERYIEDIVYSFTGLSAEGVAHESPEDLAPFGLDKPAVVASVHLMDGTGYTIYLGNRTPVGNNFYLMKQGDPKVYIVWGIHGNHFSYTLDDIRQTELTEINIQEISYFKLVREGQRTIEIKKTDELDEQQVQIGFALWHMIQPYSEFMSVHGERFSAFLSALPDLAITSFVDDNPRDLAEYGLEQPQAELKVRDSQNTLHLYFGNDMDEEHVYFKIAGSNSIYAMRKDDMNIVTEADPFELIDRFAFIVMIDYVDKIIIENNDERYTITFSRETIEATEEGEEDEIVTTYAINGRQIGEDEFKDFYQILIGLIVEAEKHEQIKELPEVVTTFFFNRENMPEARISYVPYDDDFFAVFRGGVTEFYISRKQVYDMLEDLKTLLLN